TTIDPVADVLALKDALGIPVLPKVMECFDISNITTTHIVASMVRFKNGVPDRANYRRYRIRTVKGQDDFASMAEVVRRRYARVLTEANGSAGEDAEYNQEPIIEAMERIKAQLPITLPDLIIVDGGKGQLGMACRELQRLGLHDLPIIGLAKEFEEIYRPGRPLPLQLPEDSGALRLLQRIRDEAHRFANAYHSLLLKKRISESALDEIPGISSNRKKALLAKFGSVARVRKASADQLAEVEGISPRLAEEVISYLARQK
ncbi:MAG: helix-hairpin-helix domain-containing protein, partial [Chthoniobacterales bacterium]